MTPIVYRARWILPVSRPPVDGGWLAIDGNRVVGIGSSLQSAPSEPIDLGDVTILPGLVNAHAHLEFSYLTNPMGHPGIKLYDWIGDVIRNRYEHSQLRPTASAETVPLGLKACYDSGTVLVCDIATTPFPVFETLDPRVPEVVSMAEVLGLNSTRAEQKLSLAAAHRDQFSGNRFFRAGISPHAPYSTPPNIVQQCVDLAKRHDLMVAMHVAESTEERTLIEHGDGPFADKLRELKVFSEGIFPWGEEATLDLLKMLSQAPRALVVHGNDLRDREISLMSQHRQMSVVYCPRTHAYFGHPKHPVLKLLSAGVRVALGTDSLASNPDLSLWGEVQWLLRHRQEIPWPSVLEMATLAGAEAIARHDLGRIEIGSSARLLVLTNDATTDDELGESLARHRPRWLTATPPSN